MAYTRGTSNNIIVGAAAFFVATEPMLPGDLPAFQSNKSYKDTLSDFPVSAGLDFTNVGYTMNGLELQFQPDFGEVSVDQILDVAKLYKQGMQVNLATAFAEATLENLLVAISGQAADLGAPAGKASSTGQTLNLYAGDLGECPLEKAIIAVGPGTGDCVTSSNVERVYVGYRALSIENVTVSAKRDEASMFEVSFRLLPEDTSASYGKIIDRTWA
jgi:hypothetical protein